MSVNRYSNQQGVVLIICLLMLLVISIVGLSSISTTKLEEQMASNAQVKNIVFQASEATLEDGLDDINLLSDAYDQKNLVPVPQVTKNVVLTDGRITSSTVAAKFTQEVWPKGMNAGSLNCSNPIIQIHYEMEGSADMANANARANHVQGAFIPAPGQCF